METISEDLEADYEIDKIKKKYESLGDMVVACQLERNHKGLGISLAGHKDRTKMAVYVCGLNPHGSAYKTGGLQVGDEILEVNGVVLQGRCHLNASAIIKGLPGPIFKVIVVRRKAGLEELAVKPITQFPVTLDDETPEQKYAKFKGLKTVAIKKGSHGLGIMIIEGKHAEVGQGIFISDIQEASAAQQAGLVVGDMILAVNSDTLLGANYDTAASILKKSEGVVTLVVCNPNKAREEEGAVTPGLPTTPAHPATPGLNPPRIPTPQRSPTPTEKRLFVSPSQPAPKSPTPCKSLLRVTDGAGAVGSTTPKTSPALSVRFSGLGPGPEEPPPDPSSCAVSPGRETAIEFSKDKGLGVTIVGGADTPLGCVLVSEVYPDGAVAKDGRLQPGDQLLEVDTEDLRKATHSKALHTLRQCLNKVKMLVYREERTGEDDAYQTIDVELTKKPGKGLGLSVIGRKNRPGVVIADVLHGGAAEADTRLLKGDVLLAVNGQDVKSATQDAAAAILKAASGRVALKVGRLKPTKQAQSNGKWRPLLPRTVILSRDANGLGFSIVGGSPLPVMIKTIFPEGAAEKNGQLCVGDRLLAVGSTNVENLTHEEVVTILKKCHDPVMLSVM